MENNIPAFPIHADTTPSIDSLHCGMTLLDYFAAKAAAPATQKPINVKNWLRWAFGYSYKSCMGNYDDIARNAYNQAAAMLEERKKYIK